MAKKTAAQKGYRKTVKKKPFLTKKEIIALIIIVIVVIGAFILIQNLPDGFIGEQDIQSGDLVAYAANDNKTRFLKIADANELDGFTRVNSAEGVSSLPTYTYTPDDESGNITSVALMGSAVEASYLTDSTLAYFNTATADSHATEKLPITVQGHDAYAFAYSYSFYDETKDAPVVDAAVTEEPAAEAEEPAAEAEEPVAEAEEPTAEAEEPAVEAEEPAAETEEPAPNTFKQNISLYVDYDGVHTVALHIYMNGEDESFYIPDDQVLDYLTPYTEAFTLVEKEAK